MRLLSHVDIATLNAARTILKRLEKESYDQGWNAPHGGYEGTVRAQDLGRLAQVAQTTEQAIFNVLNVANAWCDGGLTDVQLHNKPGDLGLAPPTMGDRDDEDRRQAAYGSTTA